MTWYWPLNPLSILGFLFLLLSRSSLFQPFIKHLSCLILISTSLSLSEPVTTMWLLSILFAGFSWFIWCIVPFIRNLKSARALGLPVVFSIVRFDNPIWIVFGKLFRPLLARLPAPFDKLGYYNTHDWTFSDEGKTHERLGPLIMHVSPGANELFVADATICDHVLAGRKDFVKPMSLICKIYLRSHPILRS